MWKILILVAVLPLTSCASFKPQGTKVAKSALEAILPRAADALTDAIKRRWGSDAEPEQETAACIELEGFEDEDGFAYALCRAKPVDAD